jgi:hypothetical protein
VTVNLEKNYLKLNEAIDALCLPESDGNMYLVGINTNLRSQDISIRGGDSSAQVLESNLPVVCKGIAVDGNGGIWVHNSNTGKLNKFDKKTLESKFEVQGCEDMDISKFLEMRF